MQQKNSARLPSPWYLWFYTFLEHSSVMWGMIRVLSNLIFSLFEAISDFWSLVLALFTLFFFSYFVYSLISLLSFGGISGLYVEPSSSEKSSLVLLTWLHKNDIQWLLFLRTHLCTRSSVNVCEYLRFASPALLPRQTQSCLHIVILGAGLKLKCPAFLASLWPCTGDSQALSHTQTTGSSLQPHAVWLVQEEHPYCNIALLPASGQLWEMAEVGLCLLGIWEQVFLIICNC